ncbi:MAG: hypothetical protein GXP02_02795 [Alphaproteobacteria bacterium]|nr:hypothetical protein [Alphaproteobacteria bacterium]
MFKKIFIYTLLMAFASGSALAANNNTTGNKLTKALAKYEKTGKTKLSISVSRIYDSRVINDRNILFVMNGKKAYLNTLPYRCSTLGFQKAFGYRLYTNRLSNLDTITVIDPASGFSGPTCGLGKFVEYVKKAPVATPGKS